MQATDASTLFQSDGALALGQARSSKALRTATGPEWGSPIWLGQRYKDSAGLAEAGAAADGGSARVLSLRCREGSIWTSESGGVLRRLDAETGRVESVLRGHTAPVPSFTFLRDGTVVSGSWDRSLRFWRADKQVAVVPDAGSDFIKAVHAFTLAGREYLLSGGSDKMLRCWDVTDALTPELVATMREHTRPINCLGSLVLSEDRTVLFSADSMGRVLQLELDTAARRFKVTRELRAHETSVYDLRALWVEEELDGDPTQTPIEPAGEFLSPPYEAEDGSFRRRVGQVWTCKLPCPFPPVLLPLLTRGVVCRLSRQDGAALPSLLDARGCALLQGRRGTRDRATTRRPPDARARRERQDCLRAPTHPRRRHWRGGRTYPRLQRGRRRPPRDGGGTLARSRGRRCLGAPGVRAPRSN